jgi:hypothetical protein
MSTDSFVTFTTPRGLDYRFGGQALPAGAVVQEVHRWVGPDVGWVWLPTHDYGPDRYARVRAAALVEVACLAGEEPPLPVTLDGVLDEVQPFAVRHRRAATLAAIPSLDVLHVVAMDLAANAGSPEPDEDAALFLFEGSPLPSFGGGVCEGGNVLSWDEERVLTATHGPDGWRVRLDRLADCAYWTQSDGGHVSVFLADGLPSVSVAVHERTESGGVVIFGELRLPAAKEV